MITYNENDLRELAKDPVKWNELRTQFHALKKLFEQLDEQVNERVWAERKDASKKSLQALKQGATVYLRSNNIKEIPYGSELRKVSNGRAYMQVVYNGKRWRINYSILTEAKPSEGETAVNRRLRGILSNVL